MRNDCNAKPSRQAQLQTVLVAQVSTKLSSFVLKAQASSAEDKRDAVAERIRKARLYREPSNDQALQPKQQASLTQPMVQRSVQTSTEAPENLSAYGDSQATQQAEQLLAAIQEVQQAPKASAPDAASTGMTW